MAGVRLMENENCPMCPSCFGVLLSFFRFERPTGRSPVVTEQVQPCPNAHTPLNENLGVRNGAGVGHGHYQAMGGTPTHRVSIFYTYIAFYPMLRFKDLHDRCESVV